LNPACRQAGRIFKFLKWDRLSDPELLYNEKYAFVLVCYDLDKKICRIGRNKNYKHK